MMRVIGESPRPWQTRAMTAGPPATPQPEWLLSLPPDRLMRLDVREDIRRGKEPFARIMASVSQLQPNQVFVLRAPFEPLPLYDVLGERGFAHWAEARAADDWSVWLWREESPSGRAERRNAKAARVIDVRGLEPPLPMVRILEALDSLPPGQPLVVTHERRPMLLYPQLEERGFGHLTDELGPSEFRITIWREGPAA